MSGRPYGIVILAFMWKLFGGLLGAPDWTLALSPFHHVGLVPAQPFKTVAALVTRHRRGRVRRRAAADAAR